MRSLCFPSKSPFRASSLSTAATTPPRITFSDSMIDQTIAAAASMITKWNPETSAYANVTSLFYENKTEAMLFLKCLNDLQKAMHLLASQPQDSASDILVQAQTLMQIAMKRLQKEFYQILSMNRAHLDPESVSSRASTSRSCTSDYEDDDSPEDDVRAAADSISEVEQVSSIAMADLRSIAECMISSGYAKECISIYKIIRKSIVDEGIYRLGIERVSSSKINKMDSHTLDLRIKNWLEAVKISMTTLFKGERILCDHVFAVSDSIKESCFAEISAHGATILFGFPEIVARSKKSQENKMFGVLDMYTAIAQNWPEIESIFSFESTSAVRSQAVTSLIKLGESVRTLLSDFEATIQKDSSKLVVPGGGVHPLTVYAMNYVSLLADYSNVLPDIITDWQPPAKSPSPEFYFDSPDHSDESGATTISLRFAWLILVFVCKLDGKAKHYKDVSMSYLFLANNLQHVVSRVHTSNISYLLGEEWIAKHEAKVRQFSANYERLAWGKVMESLPENPTATVSAEEAKERFKRFNLCFQEACRKQSSCVVSDPRLRDEMKMSLARKVVEVYRRFYDTQRRRNLGSFVRFAPEDVVNHLSDLFLGTTTGSVGVGTCSSSSSSSTSCSSNAISSWQKYI
ncbi:exocyst complex component EXO70A1-like [Tripterygium wilfordii]|uniref:Exocyst subunit Exo70 family protein n=1 Tax=Tripterygium wilfordii TaxID=458696 RepID=A0A7J7CSU2_TRIWF|nr:exocyst complex component EXO70H1-like [Tripterygium wilfordii]KAF5737141.1 exocyst complex component EXO70A1-like [Tripterygium wilfordii]